MTEREICPVCESRMVSVRNENHWRCLGCGAYGQLGRSFERGGTPKIESALVVLGAPEFFDYFNTQGKRQEIMERLRADRLEAARQMGRST